MGHHHRHHIRTYHRAFGAGIILNIAFVVIEAGYGIISASLALVTDAGHNLSDVIILLLAWGAGRVAAKPATDRRTYGFRKATVMASLASALLLFAALGGIAWEAFGRFRDPAPVQGRTMILVAAVGVVINTLTALFFVRGQKHDLNIRGAFLHMVADAGVSLGVVVAGIVIMAKGWLWIDPAVSLLIAAVIVFGTWGLLRDSMDYAIDAVPRGIEIPEIREYLTGFERVDRIHDLHVWPLSTTEIALTVHLVVNDDALDNDFLRRVTQHLHDHFGIVHSTLQVESAAGADNCLLDRDLCL